MWFLIVSLSSYRSVFFTCIVINMILLISGLSNKKIGRLEDALDCFYKLHAILRNSPQVIYQIADMYPL